MVLIVGLGNPGDRYKSTRHNVGFNFIEKIQTKLHIENMINKFDAEICTLKNANNTSVIFAKPQLYMNKSGEVVSKIANYYKIKSEDIYIIFDDLDIKLGEYKIQRGKYPKNHNGINNIIQNLNKDNFTYVRIGIDSRTPIERNSIPPSEYVLQKLDYNFDEIFEKIIIFINNELKLF